MRLCKKEIETIKKQTLYLDNNAKIYLFGSRIDDSKRGGDIDILLISQKLDRKSIWKIREKYFDEFGEQKFDIIIDDGSLSDPFVKKIIKNAILL